MSNTFVQGDIFKTRATAIAVGINATGRLGTSAIDIAIQDRYPVFASECRKRARADQLTPGTFWVWREGTPWIVGMVVRETQQGATRLRYVESAMLSLLKNWHQEQLSSLALMRLGDDTEWQQTKEVVVHYLGMMELPVIVYEDYRPGIAAEDTDTDVEQSD